MPNMQKTLFQFPTLVCIKSSAILQRIFNKNRKMKQQVSKLSAVKLAVCSKCKVCYVFVCIFLQICQNSNLKLSQRSRADWRENLQDNAATNWTYDGSIICVLSEIYLAFQQWKNFENPLRIVKVIAMSLVYHFFGTQCIFFFVYTVSQKNAPTLASCSFDKHGSILVIFGRQH